MVEAGMVVLGIAAVIVALMCALALWVWRDQ